MPTSIDPQPADDEIECGNCGAYFHYELTRCPNCGISVYEPESNDSNTGYSPRTAHAKRKGIGEKFSDFIRRLFKRPYPVDELFGAAINQADMFNNLLLKVGGDRKAAERLIKFEQDLQLNGNRIIWIKNAIERWEQDNQGYKST